MFSVGNDQNAADAMDCPNGGRPGELCGAALVSALITAFGFVPEAGKRTPWSQRRAPIPTAPSPAPRTTHASSVDLSVTLAALGKGANLPAANAFVSRQITATSLIILASMRHLVGGKFGRCS